MMTPLFPKSYSHWLNDRLPGLLQERQATCDSCAMIEPSGLTRDPGPFLKNLKCCTYFPYIPNFSIGLMLQSSKEVARVRLGAAAKSGLLLPQGLFASPEREVIQAKAGPSGFGRKAHLLCPFFDNAKNGCSVWEHRPGVCSSYFCKSEKNEEGLELWADIEAYLNQFEWTLANAVLWRLGFTQDDLGLSEAVMLSESSGPERAWLQKRAWVEWSGRELELYDRCASESYEIKTEELDELLGEDCLSLENSIRERSA